MNKDTALSFGTRYGKPEILIIHTLEMHNNGFNFCQAENGVWLVKHVPIKFIAFSIILKIVKVIYSIFPRYLNFHR